MASKGIQLHPLREFYTPSLFPVSCKCFIASYPERGSGLFDGGGGTVGRWRKELGRERRTGKHRKFCFTLASPIPLDK